MNKKVKISDIIISIQSQTDLSLAYLNLLTHEIKFTVSELDKKSFWAKDSKTIDDLEFDDNYIFLPTLYDFHEHQVMVDFSRTTSLEIEEHLLAALFSKDAFRKFKNLINRFFLTNEWYEYKDERFKKLAIDWCKKNNLNYEE